MGLDFNTIPPTPISGQTNNVDNSTSISDSNGSLLFYSDGSSIWNKNNVIMPNGSGLTSFFSAGQCGLIVPIPSSTKYVVFSNTEFASPGQLHYTVVDMSLNSGLGDVVFGQKNISLGTGWTEKACAIFNCNGNYYWVLMHKWNSNQFVALKVDASGVTTTSVTTGIGSNHNCGTYSAAHDAMGQLTISKDGSKIINALTCQDLFELFDFNINTGVLSNFISIPGDGSNAWGTGFSADSKKLYVNSIFGSEVFQYDLSVYNATSIINSKVSLYNTGSGGYNFGYMELGPDNKMYIPRPSTSYFAVINSPNNVGAASSFSYTGLSVAPFTTTHGISRIAYNISGGTSSSTIATTSSSSNILCFGALTASASVVASGNGSYNYLWSPGGYTTSIVNNLGAGIYTVTVTDGSCSNSTVSVIITQPSVLNTSLSVSSYSVCKNAASNLTVNSSGGTASYTVNWSTGVINSSGITVNPSITSIYNYSVTDANNCIKTQSVQINVDSTIADFNNSILPCSSNMSFTNTSVNDSLVSWDFGDGHFDASILTASNNYSVNGTYTVSLVSVSFVGCRDTIYKIVIINSNPVNVNFDYLSLNASCSDSVFFNNMSLGATTYNWNFGDGTTSAQISPSHSYPHGTYQVTLIGSNSGCSDTLVKQISVSDIIETDENSPNVFTPNNDGVNDIFDFRIVEKCSDFEFEIFDRWGLSILKSSENNQFFWDGRTTSGETVTDGTYFYIMDVNNGTKLKGTVTIFR
ncbi:MAG: gliding motility-associated C-terminal domain-containing protein [Burkholderiales bacterium]|nr:gliding motility-associated C-terminal domain-containing protein [Bacteroidia bacterium]